MFYSTNQSYHWILNQSEVAISFFLPRFFFHFNFFRLIPFFFYLLILKRKIHKTCSISNIITVCTMVVASTRLSFPAILFSLSASYNLIIFYELALLLVICPFPAILFSLSASYNLTIFYKLTLSLVIYPFPAILFS